MNREEFIRFDSVLGLKLDEIEAVEITEEEQKLIEEREQARAEKDYAKADKIRDQLKEKGLILEDKKDGVRWKRV